MAQRPAIPLFVVEWVAVTREWRSICGRGLGLGMMKRVSKSRIGGPPLLPQGFSTPCLPPIGYASTTHSSTGSPNASRRVFETGRRMVHGSSIHPRANRLKL